LDINVEVAVQLGAVGVAGALILLVGAANVVLSSNVYVALDSLLISLCIEQVVLGQDLVLVLL